jgi:hypothetical protein
MLAGHLEQNMLRGLSGKVVKGTILRGRFFFELYDCSDGKVVGSQYTTSAVGYRIEEADEIAWLSNSYELAN